MEQEIANIQAMINAAVKAGLFQDSATVLKIQQDFNTLVQAAMEGKPKKV